MKSIAIVDAENLWNKHTEDTLKSLNSDKTIIILGPNREAPKNRRNPHYRYVSCITDVKDAADQLLTCELIWAIRNWDTADVHIFSDDKAFLSVKEFLEKKSFTVTIYTADIFRALNNARKERGASVLEIKFMHVLSDLKSSRRSGGITEDALFTACKKEGLQTLFVMELLKDLLVIRGKGPTYGWNIRSIDDYLPIKLARWYEKRTGVKE